MAMGYGADTPGREPPNSWDELLARADERRSVDSSGTRIGAISNARRLTCCIGVRGWVGSASDAQLPADASGTHDGSAACAAGCGGNRILRARSRANVGFIFDLAGACSPPGAMDVAVPIWRPRHHLSRIPLLGICGLVVDRVDWSCTG